VLKAGKELPNTWLNMLSISLKEDYKIRGQESEILAQRPYNKEENREGSRCFDLY